ncbi:DNA helicase [Companilactobacillus sp. RD055328]|uniref:RNA polymerase recycling motor HelD n=1 Tax=Companilactobacillus sp. RD055328 TaxID=2916634 RepID=UPI001FC87B66|nr:RNA polymerase recycling motor HelD [Companilactobacillus sp. RD055328]GKQ42419.1 DNA helicase [Companilactobacillus sp. RD055328]
MSEDNQKQLEQKRLDEVVSKVKISQVRMQESIERAKEDIEGIHETFNDDVHVGLGDDSISMDSALSIHQQQQMLDERNNSWQQSKQRLEVLKRLEKTPYFARLDFEEPGEGGRETVYIGMSSFTDTDDEDNFLIYDWRAPISSIYYDGNLGEVEYETPDGMQSVDLFLKRQFLVDNGKIKSYFDTQETIGDQMLLEVLDDKSSTHMKSIVTTIQREQNKIIRDTDSQLLFVQGAAGSGKTSAILQRVAFLLYRYRKNLSSSQVVMFSPNQLFNDYIEDVLPEMGEQNMVQMTYLQYVARRLPNIKVEDLSQQFKDNTDASRKNINRFVSDTKFFNLITKYSELLSKTGISFRDIKRDGEVVISKERIAEIYYSFGDQYRLSNRLDATRDKMTRILNSKIGSEIRSKWVSEAIESLSKEELQTLYATADQEFKSSDAEQKFLAKKIVNFAYQNVRKKIKRNRFFNISGNYINFLNAVPQITDLSKYEITESQWQDYVEDFKTSLKNKKMSMTNITPYLYLYDLVLGRHGDLNMRFMFIDEIQDYTPFQLAYLKFNFPKARYTMLGDLNQSIFTKDNSQTLLSRVEKLFDKDSTRVVQLTHSYRSTKQITEFTRALLTNGQKIEPFNRDGDVPNIFVDKNEDSAISSVIKQLKVNDQRGDTTAIIAKTLDDAVALTNLLKDKDESVTLIKSENQRLAEGNLVIPSYLAKGLEFDAVIVWDASKDKFDEDEQQLIYTIASRAMHTLTISAIGEISQLIKKVPTEFYKLEN